MNERLDFGAVACLRVDVISETGWFDDATFKRELATYGGPEQSQYRVAWTPENAGGYAALLTITGLDGTVRRILLDTGWDRGWMDEAYAKLGIDPMCPCATAGDEFGRQAFRSEALNNTPEIVGAIDDRGAAIGVRFNVLLCTAIKLNTPEAQSGFVRNLPRQVHSRLRRRHARSTDARVNVDEHS